MWHYRKTYPQLKPWHRIALQIPTFDQEFLEALNLADARPKPKIGNTAPTICCQNDQTLALKTTLYYIS